MIVAVLALIVAPQHAGSPDRRRAEVMHVAEAPRLDGRLDEACWSTARPIGPLRQMIPVIDADPSEDTEIRLVHDGRALYFGIRCWDRDPGAIVATLRQRDADLDPDDRIEILLDTFQDRRNAYFFQIGAAGSIGDALIARNGGAFKKAWDGIFDGAAVIDEFGWTAEIEIPFATVAFDPENPTWGFNINRCIKRREEFVRWSGLTRDASFFQIARAGDLAGLDGARQGIGVDLVPFFVGRYHDARDEDSSLTGQPGLDATWRITPSLQAAVTINTDFAETEVDDRQVNLTRFPLFFPEKRDFFLQDAGIFDFADIGSGTLLPFFSRRIGLDGAGGEVPILAGGKLTGRAGDWSIGVLDVQTDAVDAFDGQNLGVARISKNLGEQSAIGIIGTVGDPTGATNTATYGADLNLSTDGFLGERNLQSSSWIVRTDDDSGSGEDLAFGSSLRYPNDFFSFALSFAEIQENFDPALGFVPRTDVRTYTGSIEIEPRHEPLLAGTIRRTQYQVDVSAVTDLDDRLQTGTVEVQPIGLIFDSADEVRLEFVARRDRLDQPFQIQSDIVIPAGEYDFARALVHAETSNKRELSGSLQLEAGTFYDGTRQDVVVGASWRPSALVNTSLEYERNAVQLDGGDFDVHVGRARVDLAFTPRVLWSNFVQFDNQSDTAGLNSRLRWTLSPGRELYIVLNPAVAREFDSLVLEETAAAFKIAYTLRF